MNRAKVAIKVDPSSGEEIIPVVLCLMKHVMAMFSTNRSDVDVLVNQIVYEDQRVLEHLRPKLRRLVFKLMEKLETNDANDFSLFKARSKYQMLNFNVSGMLAGNARRIAYFSEVLSSRLCILRYKGAWGVWCWKSGSSRSVEFAAVEDQHCYHAETVHYFEMKTNASWLIGLLKTSNWYEYPFLNYYSDCSQ